MYRLLLIFQACALILSLQACGSDSVQERVHAEISDLRSEVLALRQVQHEVQSLKTDVAAIRAQLATPKSAEVSAVVAKTWRPDGSHLDDPFLGPKQAPLVLMAFSDYQCKPCKSFFDASFDALANEFIDTGKLRFIFRDFPLEGNGEAVKAATFAHCAGEQGSYWQAYSLLFEKQAQVIDGNIESLSEELDGIDAKQFAKCNSGTVYNKEIAADIEEGIRLGAQGAPAFFIGRREGENGEFQGVFIRGAQPYELLRFEVLKQLKAQESAKAN